MPVGVTNPQTNGYNTAAYPQHSGTYIPEIWSGKLQVKFYDATVGAVMSNTDYEGEIKQVGDTVNIRTVGDVTIRDYTKGATLTYEDLEGDVLQLLINRAHYFAFKIDSIDKYQSDIAVMDKWSENASERMKINIDTIFLRNIATGVAATNAGATAGAKSASFNLGITGTPVALTKDNILDYIVDMGTVLDESNIPESGRWLILPPKIIGLIKKSDLKDASLTGDSTSLLRNGRIGIIDRFTIYSSNLLPFGVADGLAAGEWQIFAGTKHAITFASQITEMDHLAKLESTFGQAIRGLNVYGFKVVKDDAFVVGVVTAG